MPEALKKISRWTCAETSVEPPCILWRMVPPFNNYPEQITEMKSEKQTSLSSSRIQQKRLNLARLLVRLSFRGSRAPVIEVSGKKILGLEYAVRENLTKRCCFLLLVRAINPNCRLHDLQNPPIHKSGIPCRSPRPADPVAVSPALTKTGATKDGAFFRNRLCFHAASVVVSQNPVRELARFQSGATGGSPKRHYPHTACSIGRLSGRHLGPFTRRPIRPGSKATFLRPAPSSAKSLAQARTHLMG